MRNLQTLNKSGTSKNKINLNVGLLHFTVEDEFLGEYDLDPTLHTASF